jgi:hypothetical protein
MVFFFGECITFQKHNEALTRWSRGTASFLTNDLFPAGCSYSRSIPAAEYSDCFHRWRFQICGVTVSAR